MENVSVDFAQPDEAQLFIATAVERARHFSECMSWFVQSLESSADFKQVYGEIASAICTANQVVFLAVGKSGGVARLAVDMFTSVGIPAKFVHPTEAFHGDFGGISEGACCLLISNGGRSQELLAVVSPLREKRCKIVAVTSRLDSPLGREADQTLLLPPYAEKCPLGQAPISSSLSSLALCQLLVASSVEIRRFSLAEYAQNHPGGTIGKRIFVKVDDLMLKGEQLPLILGNATFAACVSKMTQYACAALLVVDRLAVMGQAKLLGLISEKDLRVAMETHGASVFNCTAVDFMNPKPIVVYSGTLAIDALAVMEERPRPLNIVPIVNQQQGVLGLLRIHDLILQGITLA